MSSMCDHRDDIVYDPKLVDRHNFFDADYATRRAAEHVLAGLWAAALLPADRRRGLYAEEDGWG